MGSAISSVVCIIPILLLYGTGHPVLFSIAVINALVEIGSVFHMRYFAKMIARTRICAEKWLSGEFDRDSPEAERFRDHMRKTISMKDVNIEDIREVPNWISGVNIAATLVGITLLIIALFIHRP